MNRVKIRVKIIRENEKELGKRVRGEKVMIK